MMEGEAIGGSPKSQRGWSLLETLLAVVMVGLGLMVWSRMQGASWGQSRTNANLLKAGQAIESDIEAIRVSIAQDSASSHWPPKDTSYQIGDLHFSRDISTASSPKDGKILANVAKVDIVVSWGKTTLDSIQISTYVSKKF